jgi:hypothetical protein
MQLVHGVLEKNTMTKLVKGCTLAVYEKLRRATIPLPSGNLLLVTIDNAGGQQQIMEKILNEVKIRDISGTISGA